MPTSASPTRDSLRAAAHADIERDLRMKVKHLECDMELMRGEVEERDSLLARAKQAIEALQGELYATRKEVDDLAEVGKEDQGMRSQLWINEVRTHTQPASASCSRKSINLMKAPLAALHQFLLISCREDQAYTTCIRCHSRSHPPPCVPLFHAIKRHVTLKQPSLTRPGTLHMNWKGR